MFLQKKENDDLVEIVDMQELIDPNKDSVQAKGQVGEEEQPPEVFKKESLKFPSGESLPRCWMDADYRNS